MLDDGSLRSALEEHWAYSGKDEDRAHEIYHDGAVIEFPQSRERFEGVANVRAWRQRYPAEVDFRLRRIGWEAPEWRGPWRASDPSCEALDG